LDRSAHDPIRAIPSDLRVSGVSTLLLACLTNNFASPLRKYLPYSYRARQRKPGILLKYSKLKATFRDQLAPFEGLWGFDSDQDFYNGTIFRFPLRGEGQGSELLESRLCPDVSTTIDMFLESFDEARLALLFLRNLTTIDFSVKRGDQFEWRVSRGTWPQNGVFSDWAIVLVEQQIPPGRITSTVEQWWRAIVDVEDAPADLQHRHKRRMKDVECGIAALVPQAGKPTESSLPPLKSRFFNCLPLKFESTLPVHIQATFLLSGDRQNIATDETSQDAGSDWNRWLLQKKLPHVYLQFLEDIGRKIGHDVYKYFPLETHGRLHVLSDLIRASFWNEIQSSSCRLFPVVDASQDSGVPRNKVRTVRRAPNMVTFQDATFDVLEKRISDALRPLLCDFLEHLVRPPVLLNKHIKRTGVKVLTPGLVRSALKSNKASEYLERAKKAEKNFLSILLSYIMPQTKAEVVELDGCPILPLADGSLGTLSLKSSSTGSCNVMYFSADPECHALFSFASSLLAASQVHEKFVDWILSSGLFNLKSLEKTDVGVVLRCKTKESWAPGSVSKAWLLRFWQYMNSTSRSTEEPIKPEILNLDSLQHLPLLLLRNHNGKETLNSLHHFQNNPAIVQVNVEEHMKLLADFPGLDIVDFGTLPESVRRAEAFLSDKASLNRFLKSIELLAVRDGKSLTDFVKANVKEKNIKVSQP
jgi:sacsin